MLANQSRRVRELFRARGRRAKSKRSVGLERPHELVKGGAQPTRGRSRRIVGSARLERSRFRGECLYLAGYDRAIGEDCVQRNETAPGEIR